MSQPFIFNDGTYSILKLCIRITFLSSKPATANSANAQNASSEHLKYFPCVVYDFGAVKFTVIEHDLRSGNPSVLETVSAKL